MSKILEYEQNPIISLEYEQNPIISLEYEQNPTISSEYEQNPTISLEYEQNLLFVLSELLYSPGSTKSKWSGEYDNAVISAPMKQSLNKHISIVLWHMPCGAVHPLKMFISL